MKKKYFLDTNIFLRFLLKDHPILSPKASQYFNQLSNNKAIIISHYLVIAEVVWVLKSFYKYSYEKINKVLTLILTCKNLKIAEKSQLVSVLNLCQEKNIDFVDAFSCLEAKKRKIKLITFDTKLAKLAN